MLIPNLGPGGAQRVFHDHSTELSKKYKVIECVFNNEGGTAYPTTNELVDLQVPGGKNLFLKLYYFILRCVRLKNIKKKYKIDLCISHLEGADYINILTKGQEGVILCIHGSKLHDLNIRGLLGVVRKKILMPFLYNRADKIITVSRDINTELIDGFSIKKDKIKTINNFFDLAKVEAKASLPLHNYKDIFELHKTIITSGRLTLQKNQETLILVFSYLVKRQPCKLVVLGDGELRDQLVAYSRKLGLKVFAVWEHSDSNYALESDIYFLGYQSNPFQFLSKSSLFAFPSAWEGFPMALCEAMICGVPVISTDCPTGPREILAPKSAADQKITEAEWTEFGVLLPMLDKKSDFNRIDIWVGAIKNLLQNDCLRNYYLKKGKERTLDFTKEGIMPEWIKIIEKVT